MPPVALLSLSVDKDSDGNGSDDSVGTSSSDDDDDMTTLSHLKVVIRRKRKTKVKRKSTTQKHTQVQELPTQPKQQLQKKSAPTSMSIPSTTAAAGTASASASASLTEPLSDHSLSCAESESSDSDDDVPLTLFKQRTLAQNRGSSTTTDERERPGSSRSTTAQRSATATQSRRIIDLTQQPVSTSKRRRSVQSVVKRHRHQMNVSDVDMAETDGGDIGRGGRISGSIETELPSTSKLRSTTRRLQLLLRGVERSEKSRQTRRQQRRQKVSDNRSRAPVANSTSTSNEAQKPPTDLIQNGRFAADRHRLLLQSMDQFDVSAAKSQIPVFEFGENHNRVSLGPEHTPSTDQCLASYAHLVNDMAALVELLDAEPLPLQLMSKTVATVGQQQVKIARHVEVFLMLTARTAALKVDGGNDVLTTLLMTIEEKIFRRCTAAFAYLEDVLMNTETNAERANESQIVDQLRHLLRRSLSNGLSWILLLRPYISATEHNHRTSRDTGSQQKTALSQYRGMIRRIRTCVLRNGVLQRNFDLLSSRTKEPSPCHLLQQWLLCLQSTVDKGDIVYYRSSEVRRTVARIEPSAVDGPILLAHPSSGEASRCHFADVSKDFPSTVRGVVADTCRYVIESGPEVTPETLAIRLDAVWKVVLEMSSYKFYGKLLTLNRVNVAINVACMLIAIQYGLVDRTLEIGSRVDIGLGAIFEEEEEDNIEHQTVIDPDHRLVPAVQVRKIATKLGTLSKHNLPQLRRMLQRCAYVSSQARGLGRLCRTEELSSAMKLMIKQTRDAWVSSGTTADRLLDDSFEGLAKEKDQKKQKDSSFPGTVVDTTSESTLPPSFSVEPDGLEDDESSEEF